MSRTRLTRRTSTLSALGVGDGQPPSPRLRQIGTESKDRVKVQAHGTRVDARLLPTETLGTLGAELIDRLQVNAVGRYDRST